MGMQRRAVALVVLLAVGAIASAAIWPRLHQGGLAPDKARPVSAVPTPVDRPPGLEFDTLRLAGSHRGVKQWELVARQVTTNDEAKTAAVEGLEKVAVYRDGKPYFTGSAERGSYNMETKDIEILGSIRLSDGDGDSFATERVTWTASTETLDMPARVEMSLDGRKVKADRARADIKGQTVTAEGNVTIEGPDESVVGTRLVYGLKDKSLSLEGQTDIEINL